MEVFFFKKKEKKQRMEACSDLVVCMCRFEDIIELEVGWQVVEAAKDGRLVYGC